MDQIARAVFVDPVLRVVEPVRIGHRVEVIEVAEELVEAVHGRQVLVQIAQVVLAELSGGVAQRLQHGGDRHRLVGHADIGAGLADGRQARAYGQFAGDKVRAARRAARLGVVVGEQHAFGGQLVEVRRLAGHDAPMIGADIEPADIVAHDDKDVGLAGRRRLRLLLRLRLRSWIGAAAARADTAATVVPARSMLRRLKPPASSRCLPLPCGSRRSSAGSWLAPLPRSLTTAPLTTGACSNDAPEIRHGSSTYRSAAHGARPGDSDGSSSARTDASRP